MEVFKIDPTFTIHLTNKTFSVPPRIESHLDHLWNIEKQKRQGKLFNGKIFACTSYDTHHLVGCFVDYKLFLCQTLDPSLYEHLKLEAVAVSGLTHAQNKILIGKRADYVLHSPGLYECVPSGGIDPSSELTLNAQLLRELDEEAGIPPRKVVGVTPFILAHEREAHLIDLCAYIEVKECCPIKREGEYKELHWLTVEQFRELDKDRCVPLSWHLVGCFHH